MAVLNVVWHFLVVNSIYIWQSKLEQHQYCGMTVMTEWDVTGHQSDSQMDLCINHHHVVPSTLRRLAVMDLHFICSLAHCTHSPYFSPVQSLMLSIHIIPDLPHPLFPSIFPSSNNLCIPFCLIKYPKYWSFLYCHYQLPFGNCPFYNVFITFVLSP